MAEVTDEYKWTLNHIIKLSNAFSPTAPIDKQDLFAGRLDQVQKVISAVVQRGQHVIMFGERGVGKTSLATVIFDILKNAGFQSMESGSINCEPTMDFSSLWHKIFRDMKVVIPAEKPMGFLPDNPTFTTSLAAAASTIITPDDVRHLLKALPMRSVIIIDELDRLDRKSNVTALLADTIKTLSDHSIDSTLILVGVADTVDGLITEHQSVERALMQIQMKRMSEDEIREILDKCFAKTEVTIDERAKEFIVRLSKGLPHYTHLLGLHAGKTAVKDIRTVVTFDDVKRAIGSALEDSQQSVQSAYHKAISSPRPDNLYPQALLACALARTDFLGYFLATDVKQPMSMIMNKPCEIPMFGRHLAAFCSDERGNILQRIGEPRSYQYRFTNPLLQPFVILRGIQDGLIEDYELDKL